MKGQLAVFFAGSLVLVLGFLLSTFAAWPTNVLSGPLTDPVREVFATTVPQGWAFFTKNPEESQPGVYDMATGENLMVTPQSRPENLFGLSRNQRAQGPEIASLAASTSLVWTDCKNESAVCLADAAGLSPVRVENVAFSRTICGEVELTEEQITPWAYREFSGVGDRRLLRYAPAVVSCPDIEGVP